MNDALVVGVDIGGSHITAALVDTRKRTLVKESWKRKKLNSMAAATEIIELWTATIRACMETANLRNCSIGIAMPGPFDYEQGISGMKNQNKYDSLYGLNIRVLLAEALQLEPEQIYFSNDAACFLQGELYAGFAESSTPAAGFTLGTGLGSACCYNGKASDANLWCAPFKDATAEDYLSSRWFVERYHAITGEEAKDVESIARQSSSESTMQLFNEFGEHLGEFLAPYIQQYQWKLVVFGGSISKAFPLFEKALLTSLKKFNTAIPVQSSSLGEQAALLGAGSLCTNYQHA